MNLFGQWLILVFALVALFRCRDRALIEFSLELTGRHMLMCLFGLGNILVFNIHRKRNSMGCGTCPPELDSDMKTSNRSLEIIEMLFGDKVDLIWMCSIRGSNFMICLVSSQS